MKDNIVILMAFIWCLTFTILKTTSYPTVSWWIVCAPLWAVTIFTIIALSIVIVTRDKKDSDR